MKTTKRTFLFAFGLLLLSSTANLNAQVTIGAETAPKAYSLLELNTTEVKAGLRLPQLTTSQRDALAVGGDALANGLIIYNTDTDCMETWNGADWVSNCGTIASSPATFDLNGAGTELPPFTNLDLTGGTSSVTLKVVVNDTEVGNTFKYQWYVQDITEQYANKGFTKLASATSAELTLTSTGSRSNKRYYCQVVKEGTTEVKNTAYCRVLIGGCGANVGTNNAWVEFKCHNLGAIETDPFVNSVSILGDNYQFGQAVPILTRAQSLQYYYTVPFDITTPTTTNADWPAANNPCPAGWSIMTKDHGDKIAAYSDYISVGYDWIAREDNFSTGIAIGYYLFFPTTGWRNTDTGTQISRGYNTLMWTRTNSTNSNAYQLRLYRQQQGTSSGATNTSSVNKKAIKNVRCVKD